MTDTIREILVRYFGEKIVQFAENAGIKAHVLTGTYREASRELRRLGVLGVNVDSWPLPPAGLFVVAERTLYLKTPTVMTVVHEFGHALDCALGGSVYRSGYDQNIRSAFVNARSFVTPYAATGLDEYFAESVRAYVGANDPMCPWLPVTRERLQVIDPRMHDTIRDIFAEINNLEALAA